MSKQYGLILPGEKQKSAFPTRKLDVAKPSIFDESSESENEGPPLLGKIRNAPITAGTNEKRIARKIQEKALAEDPTIFQYDELYDEMEDKRESEKKSKSTEEKKPKYIGLLLEHAVRRKIENERRIERMVQKEREEEGEEFNDKESFVTVAYRKKLEEFKKADAIEKRDDYLEAIGDVTKQKDLDGFYRHLYELKTGTCKVVEKPTISAPTEEISYKPIKSGKPRTYRKRCSSAEEDDGQTNQKEIKKAHIQSNLDADSDFSIDSSSSEEENDNEATKKKVEIVEDVKASEESTTGGKQISEAVKKNITLETKIEDNTTVLKEDNLPPPAPKKDKSLIWKKRTVGEVYDAALKRYFERSALRNSA